MRNWSATMTTIKELESRIERANALLKKDLPPKDRLRVAGLRLLDQKRVALRNPPPAAGGGFDDSRAGLGAARLELQRISAQKPSKRAGKV
jgi:hypothetical protein